MKVSRPADFICNHPARLVGAMILFFTVIVIAIAVMIY